jgi:hypothetical protein
LPRARARLGSSAPVTPFAQRGAEWHWANGVSLHPVYVPKYHRDGTREDTLRRFSCRVCIFSTDADLAAIRANDPVAFQMVADLERKLIPLSRNQSLSTRQRTVLTWLPIFGGTATDFLLLTALCRSK